jgi:hypothetical protein
MRHGAYGRPQAIPRGLLRESEEDVETYVEAIVAALDPRDAPELVIARRIATSDLRLARLERYEGVAMAKVGRLRTGLNEMPPYEVEGLRHLATAAHLASLSVDPDSRLVSDVDTWEDMAMVIYDIHDVPPNQRYEPNVSPDDPRAAEVWAMFFRDSLIPKYWDSSESASAALAVEYQRLCGIYRQNEGVAEERAVTEALAKGGPMDAVSTLRARVQRE